MEHYQCCSQHVNLEDWKHNWEVFLHESEIKLENVRVKGAQALVPFGGHPWTNAEASRGSN